MGRVGLRHRRSRRRPTKPGASPFRPDEECYTLRRVWLDDADINGYYHGFANRALWPLCHMLIQHFEFRTEYWERYRTVNLRFAHAVADEAERCTGRAMAWIQDYHFALAAEFLRAMRPSLFIHQFWHIPFPPPDILRLLADRDARSGAARDARQRSRRVPDRPLRRELPRLRGAIRPRSARRSRAADGRVSRPRRQRRRVPDQHRRRAVRGDGVVAGERRRASTTLRDRYARGDRQLGVCVDRVDYTKGIPERMRALETLWEESPELRERFTFIFVCTPSRTDLPAYNALERDVIQSVIAINEKYGNRRLDADRA